MGFLTTNYDYYDSHTRGEERRPLCSFVLVFPTQHTSHEQSAASIQKSPVNVYEEDVTRRLLSCLWHRRRRRLGCSTNGGNNKAETGQIPFQRVHSHLRVASLRVDRMIFFVGGDQLSRFSDSFPSHYPDSLAASCKHSLRGCPLFL